MKRLISFLTVMVIVVGIMPIMSVSAATVATTPMNNVVYGELWDTTKWSVIDKTTGFTYSKNAKWQVSVSTAQAYEGQRSLHIYWDDPVADGTSEWPALSMDSKKKFPAGTYTFTMYQYAPKGTDPLINGFAHFMVLDSSGTKNNIWAEGTGVAENPDKPDWLKYSKTITLSNECELKFLMNFKSYADRGPYDMYLDNLSFVNNENPDVNLLEGSMSTFERAETESDMEQDVWAVYRMDSTAVGYNYTMQKSSAYAASGENSLHLGWHLHEGSRFNAWAVAKINYRETKLAAGNYLFSCKIKSLTDLAQLKFNVGSQSGKTIRSFTDYASEADENGWVTYTDIPFTMSSEGNFEFIMNGDITSEFYLDDVIITKADDTSKTNLLSYYASTFDDIISFPDITGKSIDTTFWSLAHNLDKGETEVIGETSMETAYEGRRSLHLKRVGNGQTTNIWPRSAMLEAGKEYTMTAYINAYEDGSDGASVKMAFANWQGESISNAEKIVKTTETEKPGWVKYTYTATVGTSYPNGPMILINPASGKTVDIYIDNISIYATDDDTKTNLLADSATGINRGSFEAESGISPDFEASSVRLFDENMTEITKLTNELSGKEVTAAAAVMNESAGDDFTGQIILCVYDGLEMKYSTRSDIQTIAEGDGATLFTSKITLPVYSEVGNLKVKVFLWDSVTGMYPLIDEVAEF